MGVYQRLVFLRKMIKKIPFSGPDCEGWGGGEGGGWGRHLLEHRYLLDFFTVFFFFFF